jgi:hypothetical protein
VCNKREEKMRQWNVNPEYLCTQHLLGEHLEQHMFMGCIKKGTSLKGYIDKGLVEIHNITNRHNELVVEMLKRGYKHKSPMDEILPCREIGSVDSKCNIEELKRRCPKCRERIRKGSPKAPNT